MRVEARPMAGKPLRMFSDNVHEGGVGLALAVRLLTSAATRLRSRTRRPVRWISTAYACRQALPGPVAVMTAVLTPTAGFQDFVEGSLQAVALQRDAKCRQIVDELRSCWPWMMARADFRRRTASETQTRFIVASG